MEIILKSKFVMFNMDIRYQLYQYNVITLQTIIKDMKYKKKHN